MNGPPGADAERIASSMETTPELLPYLPALLQDLDSLTASSWPPRAPPRPVTASSPVHVTSGQRAPDPERGRPRP
jgi:hypothetical protein